MSPDSRFRPAIPTDAVLIGEMARRACAFEDRPVPDVDSDEVQELLTRAGDVALVADDETGRMVGAIWKFEHDPGLIGGRDGIPSPKVAIAPTFRGRGLGGELLDKLLVVASGRYEALILNNHRRSRRCICTSARVFELWATAGGALGVAVRDDL